MGWTGNDGKTYSSSTEANEKGGGVRYSSSSSSNKPSAPSASDNEKQRHCDAYNQMVRFYNASDWDGVIKTYEADKDGTYRIGSLYPLTGVLVCIAYANRDDNYETAFFKLEQYKRGSHLKWSEEEKMLYQELYNSGKKAWEKKHGRAMTDADLKEATIQKEISMQENFIVRIVRGEDNLAFENLESDIPKWEELTGRAFTKEDEIRIYGKPFLKRGFSGKVKW
jgi:hypothetical protein